MKNGVQAVTATTSTVRELCTQKLIPSTHRRRRRDSTVELNCVGGVNAPVGSRDPVYNFLRCWAVQVVDKWWHNDVLLKKLSISIKIHVVKRLWSLFGQFPNCRPNCVHTADATRLNSAVASRRRWRCVLGFIVVCRLFTAASSPLTTSEPTVAYVPVLSRREVNIAVFHAGAKERSLTCSMACAAAAARMARRQFDWVRLFQ